MDASFDFVRRIVPETSTSFMVPSAVTTPLLDSLAATSMAAFSTRKLRAAYAGSAIRVERSSDTTQQDIGFDGSNNLDTSALTSFVGAGDGVIVTWYDQSGNAVNATRNAARGKGPLIVSSGVVQTLNGRATAVYADTGVGAGNKTLLFYTGPSAAQPFTYSLVVRQTTKVSARHITDGADGITPRNLVTIAEVGFDIYAGGAQGVAGGTSSTNTSYGIIGVFNTAGTSEIFVDNSSVASSSGQLGSNVFGTQMLGGSVFSSVDNSIDGVIPELIILNGVVSSGDRSTITSSWASYWGTP